MIVIIHLTDYQRAYFCFAFVALPLYLHLYLYLYLSAFIAYHIGDISYICMLYVRTTQCMHNKINTVTTLIETKKVRNSVEITHFLSSPRLYAQFARQSLSSTIYFLTQQKQNKEKEKRELSCYQGHRRQ